MPNASISRSHKFALAAVVSGVLLGIAIMIFPSDVEAPRPAVRGPGSGRPSPEERENLLTAGRASNVLRVAGTVPLPGELFTGRLTVFFDQPIMTKPAAAEEANLITFSPPLEGTFSVGANYIDFRASSYTPNQIYEARLALSLRGENGAKLPDTLRPIVLSPVVFTAQELFLLEETAGETTLGLTFSATIDATALNKYIDVMTETGNNVPIEIGPGSNPQTARILIRRNAEWPVTVTARAGLPEAGGRLTMDGDKAFKYPLDRALAVLLVKWGAISDERQEVVIEFNRSVTAASLNEHLTITDGASGEELEYELIREDYGGRRHTAAIHHPDVSAMQISIDIAEGLQGSGQSTLAEAYHASLERMPEPLRVDYGWFGETEDGAMSYTLSFNENVDPEAFSKFAQWSPTPANWSAHADSGRYLRVTGEWNSRTSYTLRLRKGMPYGAGGKSKLREDVLWAFESEDIPKYLGFEQDDKFYIPRRPELALRLKSRNVETAKVTIHRLFPSNIAVALDDLYEGQGSPRLTETWSEEVLSKDLPIAIQRDRMVETALPLDPLFPADKRGVFCVRVTGAEWREARKVILWTDIGALAQWQRGQLVLFAHDLFSLEPREYARVRVYSIKNQLVADGYTAPDGIVRFNSLDENLGAPRVAVIEHGGDYTFLELKPREEGTTRFETVMAAYDREAYDAFLYADRDLYRPGETAHLRWSVRRHYGDAVAGVPLLLEIVKPSGHKLLSQTVSLSDLGTGGYDLTTQKAYPTGSYEARLLVPGTESPIGTYAFRLEEFVPNRIKATVSLTETTWIGGKTYPVAVNAQHLFGAPAANRKAEAAIALRRGGFTSAPWEGFRFDNDSEYNPESIPLGETTTDENGNAQFEASYTPGGAVTFPLRATVIGRVYELGGRAVAGKAEALVFPSDIALGISATPGPGGQGVEVFVAAIRPDESAAPLESVQVTLERQIWNYYVRRYYSNYEPRWSTSFQPVETKEVPLKDGRGSVVLKVDNYGYFRVKVHSAKTPQYSTVSFYSYGGQCDVVASARPSLISISLDKEVYTIGDTARIQIESPFNGKGIVVIQGERIQDMIPITIENKVGRIELPITSALYPNVWVEATIIHAIEKDHAQVYPFSSAAVTPLRIHDPQRALQVSFPELPAETRPDQEVTFTVHVADAAGSPAAAELTLAAVDEGIHAITAYENPEPVAWLERLRRPEYNRAHYYDKVAYDFERMAIGGDSELAARLGAAGESWIKPVSLWSGPVRTGPDGRATVTMRLPEFSGQLRLVAVANGSASLGAGAANVYVRRPFMMRTSAPRFLLPGDAFDARAGIFNNTDAPGKVKISWRAEGAVTGPAESIDIEIAPHQEASHVVRFTAADTVGSGAVIWEAVVSDAAGNALETLTERLDIPVNAPAVYQIHGETVALNPGERREFKNTLFLDDERASVSISAGANPLMRLEDSMKRLVSYPYGCVEQTTSRLLPMYVLRKQQALLEGALEPDMRLDAYLLQGINRLFAMQTPEGGLGFWPGAAEPSPYGSVYALHFLTLVKRGKEFELPEESFKALQNYVRNMAFDATQTSQAQRYLRAYALYCLALDGDIQAIQQIGRFDDTPMPRAARLLLAAALAQATQDTDRVRQYLSKAPGEEYVQGQFGEIFASELRDKAVELLALLQIGGDLAETAKQADDLLASLAKHHGSTQETAFMVTALAAYLERVAENISAASFQLIDAGATRDFAGAQVGRARAKGPGAAIEVANLGATPLYVNVATAGVPREMDTAPLAEGIEISRTYFTRDGEEISGTAFNQTDSFVVALSITCSRPLDYVVIADLLPAGFEIENPRLDADVLPGDTFKGAEIPSYLEVRDDRLVIAYDQMQARKYKFYYVARAVTPGAYTYPPLNAECMYDAAVRARSGGGRVEIR